MIRNDEVREIEKAMLGSIMLDPSKYAEVASIVTADDILSSDSRAIYRAIKFLASEGTPLDILLIRQFLASSGDLERIGGTITLANCQDAVTSGENAKYYASKVRDASIDRSLAKIMESGYSRYIRDGDIKSAIKEIVVDAKQVMSDDARQLVTRQIYDVAMGCLDPSTHRNRISTGYRSIDAVHNSGLARKSLTLIGAAPSVGKTQMALNLAASMQIDGNMARVLIVSMEMSEEDIVPRFIALISNISIRTVQQFFMLNLSKSTRLEYGDRVERALVSLKNMPVTMISGSYGPQDLHVLAEKYDGQYDVMIVDYLQLMRGDKGLGPRERVEAASKACKEIAMQHDVAVIAVASINREGYKDKGARPQMQHLRESGNIEFDADNVWMLWREKDDSVSSEDLELYIRKQRNGPLGTVHLEFNLPTGIISDKPY